MDWTNPIKDVPTHLQPAPFWADWLIAPFDQLCQVMGPCLDDALVRRSWEEALAILDLQPGPPDSEEGNRRWREVVAICWAAYESHLRRGLSKRRAVSRPSLASWLDAKAGSEPA